MVPSTSGSVPTAMEADQLPNQRLSGRFSRYALEQLDSTLGRHIGPGRLPGLVAIVRRGDEEHSCVLGNVGFDRADPMRKDTIFRMASVTKIITAVAAMILIEECRLRLDDPVDELLPELANRRVLRTVESQLEDTVPAIRPITVRDLLTFRSGYGEVRFLSPTCPLQTALAEAQLPLSTFYFPGDADEFMKRLANLPLASQPGELWLYHMSAEILGVLVARAAGTSLSSFVKDRILGPLGMKDTGFSVPQTELARLASCYAQDLVTADVVELEEAGSGIYATPPEFESGAGDQFVSTADDMLTFGQMLLNKGKFGNARILSRLSIEAMRTDQLSKEQKARSPFFPGFWASRGWGLGVGLITMRDDVAAVPDRFGWDGAFSTSLYVDPRENLVLVFMAQCRPGSMGLHTALRDFWTSAYAAAE